MMANPSDAALQNFLDSSFDPADYLNRALPSLTLSSQPHTLKEPQSAPLPDLASQTQSLLSQLTTQHARLSNTLTQLTDEILRSGGRLAYEVEVLRGDSIGLSEALTELLQEDMNRFLPPDDHVDAPSPKESRKPSLIEETENLGKDSSSAQDPPFLSRLRMLCQVRNRLEEVIHTFGEAMEWPLAPSEVSVASSFISVSGPDPSTESHSREEKGREVAKKIRSEISDLLQFEGRGMDGVEAAEKRVEELSDLVVVWKGTAEERARNKFVDSLAKQVEARRKQLENQSGTSKRRDPVEQSPWRASSRKGGTSVEQARDERSQNDGTLGFMKNLQRLRDEIYLE